MGFAALAASLGGGKGPAAKPKAKAGAAGKPQGLLALLKEANASGAGLGAGAAPAKPAEAPKKKKGGGLSLWKKAGMGARMGAAGKIAGKKKRESKLDQAVSEAKDIRTGAHTRVEHFEAEFDRRMAQFRVRRNRMEEEMKARHNEQLRLLKDKFKQSEHTACAASPQVLALRRKQSALLQAKAYSEAFDHMKTIKKAEREAVDFHKESIRAENSLELARLIDEQEREREHFLQKIQVEEQNLMDFKYAKMTELTTNGSYQPSEHAHGASSGPSAAPTAAPSRIAPGPGRAPPSTAIEATPAFQRTSVATAAAQHARQPHTAAAFMGHYGGYGGSQSTPAMPSTIEPPRAAQHTPSMVAAFSNHYQPPKAPAGWSTPAAEVPTFPAAAAGTTVVKVVPQHWQSNSLNFRPQAAPAAPTPGAGASGLAAQLLSTAAALLGSETPAPDNLRRSTKKEGQPFVAMPGEERPGPTGPGRAAQSGAPQVPIIEINTKKHRGQVAGDPGPMAQADRSDLGPLVGGGDPGSDTESEFDEMDTPLVLDEDGAQTPFSMRTVPTINLKKVTPSASQMLEKLKQEKRRERRQSLTEKMQGGAQSIARMIRASKALGAAGEDMKQRREAPPPRAPEGAQKPTEDQRRKAALLFGAAMQANRGANAFLKARPQPASGPPVAAPAPAPPSAEASPPSASPSARGEGRSRRRTAREAEADQVKAMKKAQRAQRAAETNKRSVSIADFNELFSFCRHGKYKHVTELLKKGAPPDGRDKFGNTPLMVGCQNGHARIVKACLRHGADPDCVNKQGNTGLHYCIAYGFSALGDYLIAKGANDKIKNKMGLTCYEGIK